MRIVTDWSYIEERGKEITYQQAFLLKSSCSKCERDTHLMMLIDDDESLIAGQNPPTKKGIWPHDAMAIALYFCCSCGVITARWNQG